MKAMGLEAEYTEGLRRVFCLSVIAWLFKGDDIARLAAVAAYATAATESLRTQMLREVAQFCAIQGIDEQTIHKGFGLTCELSSKKWGFFETAKIRRVLAKSNRAYKNAISTGQPHVFVFQYPDILEFVTKAPKIDFELGGALFDLGLAEKARQQALARLDALSTSRQKAASIPRDLLRTVAKCSACKADLITGHTFCGHCGARVEANPSKLLAASIAKPPKDCPSCGLTNVGSAERCDCGRVL